MCVMQTVNFSTFQMCDMRAIYWGNPSIWFLPVTGLQKWRVQSLEGPWKNWWQLHQGRSRNVWQWLKVKVIYRSRPIEYKAQGQMYVHVLVTLIGLNWKKPVLKVSYSQKLQLKIYFHSNNNSFWEIFPCILTSYYDSN